MKHILNQLEIVKKIDTKTMREIDKGFIKLLNQQTKYVYYDENARIVERYKVDELKGYVDTRGNIKVSLASDEGCWFNGGGKTEESKKIQMYYESIAYHFALSVKNSPRKYDYADVYSRRVQMRVSGNACPYGDYGGFHYLQYSVIKQVLLKTLGEREKEFLINGVSFKLKISHENDFIIESDKEFEQDSLYKLMLTMLPNSGLFKKVEVEQVSSEIYEKRKKHEAIIKKLEKVLEFLDESHKDIIINKYYQGLREYLARANNTTVEEGRDLLITSARALFSKIYDTVYEVCDTYMKQWEQQEALLVSLCRERVEERNSDILWHLERLQERKQL